MSKTFREKDLERRRTIVAAESGTAAERMYQVREEIAQKRKLLAGSRGDGRHRLVQEITALDEQRKALERELTTLCEADDKHRDELLSIQAAEPTPDTAQPIASIGDRQKMPMEKLRKIADGLRVQDPSLTSVQAMAQAIRANPGLYQLYNDGKDG